MLYHARGRCSSQATPPPQSIKIVSNPLIQCSLRLARCQDNGQKQESESPNSALLILYGDSNTRKSPVVARAKLARLIREKPQFGASPKPAKTNTRARREEPTQTGKKQIKHPAELKKTSRSSTPLSWKRKQIKHPHELAKKADDVIHRPPALGSLLGSACQR